LQERETELAVLANGNESSGGIEPLSKRCQLWLERQTTKRHICEKEGEQINKAVGKMLVCLQRSPDLMFA
jgi:predicted amidophosphoribosyltransferase